HSLGRDSAVGHWEKAFNYPRFVSDVLDPLGPEGDRRYRVRAHDLETDSILDDEPWRDASERVTFLCDGIFMQRPELAGRWSFVVYLDVPFHETHARMAVRDGTSPNPDERHNRR